jgi:hypothetical protein
MHPSSRTGGSVGTSTYINQIRNLSASGVFHSYP